jgi:hypothetical protein
LLGLLLLAYVTKRQPVILPRYSLVFFALGLPMSGWLLQHFLDRYRPRLLVTGAALLLCIFAVSEWRRQIPIILKVRADFRAHEQVARMVRTALQQSSSPNARVFSDDVGIRVLSGLAPNCFVRSGAAPERAWNDINVFESYLRDQHADYLVFTRNEDSIPPKLYSDLGRVPLVDVGKYEFVTMAPSSFGPDVWLYRVRDTNQSP